MKHTKLMILGLTAAMTFGGAATVFADETGNAGQDTAVTAEDKLPEIDMSGLELPENFVPFDENHVPDGQNAPANGELKPVEFDDDGNMTFGQKPEGMPPVMDGERPELPEGELPELQRGESPRMLNGERPELPEGEVPEWNGGIPELPEGGDAFDDEWSGAAGHR